MYKFFLKRLIDLLIACIALPFWLIILLVFGPIIYLQDKGPVFYNSSRLGKDGQVFKMYKFRSMKVNAPDLRNQDGSTYNSENDPRLTNIGKFMRKTSLDETPQLLNIFKGEMSIIGPRPDMPEAINIYTPFEARKLKVRPGITGYNQAFYRNSVHAKDKFKNDIFYVENLTFSLDIKIIIKTFLIVLLRKNVFHEEQN
ncbi:sugar transferase [Bacillus sp. JJ1609]|uniref:sugar transferase n=1 Tax=Bacillus sp. JJ1609 TaxID=3122977 RepID=UPI0030376808